MPEIRLHDSNGTFKSRSVIGLGRGTPPCFMDTRLHRSFDLEFRSGTSRIDVISISCLVREYVATYTGAPLPDSHLLTSLGDT
jgi:hypothetical protein